MKVTQITYEQLFTLGKPYTNERLSITVALGPKDSVATAFKRARATVLKSSSEAVRLQKQAQMQLAEADSGEGGF